jgi:hypothetical protein
MEFFYCVAYHNLEPSLTIIMNDGDQIFQKENKFYVQKSS